MVARALIAWAVTASVAIGCASNAPIQHAARARVYIIDDDFTPTERAQIEDAVLEWNLAGIIQPCFHVAPVDMTPHDVALAKCTDDCTFVQRGPPPGDPLDTGAWGVTFWYGAQGDHAIAYMRVQDLRVYRHEIGHTLGLPHSDYFVPKPEHPERCIMWGSVSDIARVTACDYSALCLLWGCPAPPADVQ